jgi:hypothetical protein
MPRLIARLIQAFENSKSRAVTSTLSRSPLPQSNRTAQKPSYYVPSLPRGRTRSVLLDEVNPITDKDAFRIKKTIEPRECVISFAQGESKATDTQDEPPDEQRRAMTAEERGWWANPYRTSDKLF